MRAPTQEGATDVRITQARVDRGARDRRRGRQLRDRQRCHRLGLEFEFGGTVDRRRPVDHRQASPPTAGQPWGGQRSDETPLTGDTKSKVEAAAKAKLSGATIVRTETDGDGNATYEVHMVQTDGTPATVYVNEQFAVVSVQTGMPGGHDGPEQQPSA